jgi:hypothetical protein
MNCLFGSLAGFNPLASKVDNHDSVLLDDPHQHKHADEGVKRSLLAKHNQRQ